ncbi:hypothetical protein FF1_041809 [Malus domestica]
MVVALKLLKKLQAPHTSFTILHRNLSSWLLSICKAISAFPARLLLNPDTHSLSCLNQYELLKIALARTRLTSEFRWNPKPGPDVLVSTLAPNGNLALIPFCHIPDRLRRSTILSALGHALTVLFLGFGTRTSQGVTHPKIALA